MGKYNNFGTVESHCSVTVLNPSEYTKGMVVNVTDARGRSQSFTVCGVSPSSIEVRKMTLLERGAHLYRIVQYRIDRIHADRREF